MKKQMLLQVKQLVFKEVGNHFFLWLFIAVNKNVLTSILSYVIVEMNLMKERSENMSIISYVFLSECLWSGCEKWAYSHDF